SPPDRCLGRSTARPAPRTPSARSARRSRRRTACGSTRGRTPRPNGRRAARGRPSRTGGSRRATHGARCGTLLLRECRESPRRGTLPNRITGPTRQPDKLPAVVTIAVPAETAAAERRVALVPEVIGRLTGAGVAGLQAIATARRLGAVVEGYDVRAAAAEEVRSLGATFVELELETQEGTGGYAKEQSEDFLARQRELIGKHVAASDVVITTA